MNICNKVDQVGDATLDVEVHSIDTPLEDLMNLRSSGKGM